MKWIAPFIIILHALLIFSSFSYEDDEEIFTSYCSPGLCRSGTGTHIGCIDEIRHNGQFQEPPCKPGTSKLITLTEADKHMIIDWHNYQRNYVACGGLMKDYNFKPACRMGAVKWDRELEATAHLHVTYCTMEHDMCRSTLKYPYSGQNIGWYCTNESGFNFTKVIQHHLISWYMEYQDAWEEVLYNYTSETWHRSIGHFMISIHEKNVRLGCALAYVFELTAQSMSSIFTCNYAFTNIFYSPTYSYCEVPASKCETGTDSKYPYLCSTHEKYNWREKVKLFPYTGHGTESYDCGLSPDIVQNAPEYLIKKRTTLKPSSKPDLTTEPTIKKTTTLSSISTSDISTKPPDLKQNITEDTIQEATSLEPSSTFNIPTTQLPSLGQNLSQVIIKETTTLKPEQHSQIPSKPSSTFDIPTTQLPSLGQNLSQVIIKETTTLKPEQHSQITSKPSSTFDIPTTQLPSLKQNLSQDIIKGTTTLKPDKHITSKPDLSKPSRLRPQIRLPSGSTDIEEPSRPCPKIRLPSGSTDIEEPSRPSPKIRLPSGSTDIEEPSRPCPKIRLPSGSTDIEEPNTLSPKIRLPSGSNDIEDYEGEPCP